MSGKKPNLRELYKNKGKKIVHDKEQAKIITQEKLTSGIETITSRTQISPLIEAKLLRLGITTQKTSNSEPLKQISFKKNKDTIQLLVLKFGLIYQRSLGTAISSVNSFYDQFCKHHPEIIDYDEKDMQDTFNYLNDQGLLFQFSTEILFEPLERSKDINALFSLLNPSDESLSIHNIKANLSWPDDKINNIIDILVENGIVIHDGEIIWFPQLST